MTALLPICEVPLACLWVHVKVMGQNHHCVCLSVSLHTCTVAGEAERKWGKSSDTKTQTLLFGKCHHLWINT